MAKKTKPALLYASPFPPLHTGIAEYSVMLVKALEPYFDITLYVDQDIVDDPELADFPVLRHGRDRVDFDRFSALLYNMGNNAVYHEYIYDCCLEHPGTVILHDEQMFHFIFNYARQHFRTFGYVYEHFTPDTFYVYKDAVKRHDNLELMNLSPEVSMNDQLLRSGNRIMVHSQYTMNRLLNTGLIGADRVRKINHLALLGSSVKQVMSRKELSERFGIPEDATVIATAGAVNPNKKNRELCAAVRRLSEEAGKKVCCLMIGEGEYADDLLMPGLIIRTGYVPLNDFNALIAGADIMVNLRFPTLGETSGALLRILQQGKVCIVNDDGWYGELPETICRHIGSEAIEEQLYRQLLHLIEHPQEKERIGLAAAEYVKTEHNAEKIGREVAEWIMEKNGK